MFASNTFKPFILTLNPPVLVSLYILDLSLWKETTHVVSKNKAVLNF